MWRPTCRGSPLRPPRRQSPNMDLGRFNRTALSKLSHRSFGQKVNQLDMTFLACFLISGHFYGPAKFLCHFKNVLMCVPISAGTGHAASLILAEAFGVDWPSQNVRVMFVGDDTSDEDVMQVFCYLENCKNVCVGDKFAANLYHVFRRDYSEEGRLFVLRRIQSSARTPISSCSQSKPSHICWIGL